MTTDTITVRRVYEGERCGDSECMCPHYHEENDDAPSFCSAFEAEDDEQGFDGSMKHDSLGLPIRLRACLATPAAVLVTGEMLESGFREGYHLGQTDGSAMDGCMGCYERAPVDDVETAWKESDTRANAARGK